MLERAFARATGPSCICRMNSGARLLVLVCSIFYFLSTGWSQAPDRVVASSANSLFHTKGMKPKTSHVNDREILEVVAQTIQEGDTVFSSSGLVITFSHPVDLGSLGAEDLIPMSYYYLEEMYTDSSKWFIGNCENVTLNGSPLSCWYDSQASSFAFFHETTVMMPEGTGTGMVVADSNTFIIQDILNLEGEPLATDFVLTFYGNDDQNFKSVPNPYISAAAWDPAHFNPRIHFIHLPQVATISIFDHSGDPVRVLEHDADINDGVEVWDLRDDAGDYVPPGIYQWQVEGPEIEPFEHGVLLAVFPGADLLHLQDWPVLTSFRLKGVYPNPFNPRTTISCELSSPTDLTITIYDLIGRRVFEHNEVVKVIGQHTLTWRGVDLDGNKLSSGIYVLQISSSDGRESVKLLLLE